MDGGWVKCFTFEHDVMMREKDAHNIIIMFGGYDVDWLRNDVHIADHVTSSVLDLHIVAEMRTKSVHYDELRSDREAVSITAACIFLDGGAPEAPESHRRAVRTPAPFLGMSRETAVLMQRDGTCTAAIDAKAATVAGCCSLVTLWILVCCGWRSTVVRWVSALKGEWQVGSRRYLWEQLRYGLRHNSAVGMCMLTVLLRGWSSWP